MENLAGARIEGWRQGVRAGARGQGQGCRAGGRGQGGGKPRPYYTLYTALPFLALDAGLRFVVEPWRAGGWCMIVRAGLQAVSASNVKSM